PQLSAASLNGTQYVFVWPAGIQQTYQLEYKDDLATNGWASFGPALLGNGQAISITNELSASTHRFFRLRILP
ncbi:MAG TPA: hypothetical protein VFE51_16030, partial [Verrucomicrobiae bacterium]|nr:hypothetical protein [Verrucomicrobiae bacterium]